MFNYSFLFLTCLAQFQVPYRVGSGTGKDDILEALRETNTNPPVGANDVTCKVTDDSPPVILVHGTFENQNNNWGALSPLLRNKGRCPWTFNFGKPPNDEILNIAAPAINLDDKYGLGDIENSAQELANFVQIVLKKTGAKKVDLVGHSQGGMMPHVYLRDMGGAEFVRKFVALAPSNHGTDFSKVVPENTGILVGEFYNVNQDILNQIVRDLCVACSQQQENSEFMQKLNSKPLAVPSVEYTVIVSKYDSVVMPYETQYMENAKNYLLQKGCPSNLATHVSISYDKRALGMVINAINNQTTPLYC